MHVMFQELKLYSEQPSVYFNDIIRQNVVPLTVDGLAEETVANFNNLVAVAFTDEKDSAIRRLRYLIPYILQNIDWERYATPLEPWQLRYYYQRERFLKKSGLTYENFIAHAPLQAAIAQLGLMPEPVFEFILFLKYYYNLRSDLKYSSIEQFDALCKKLQEDDCVDVTMDVCIGGKHIRINNSAFVREIFHNVNRNNLSHDAFANDFDQGPSRDKIRVLDYYLVKTLLDYLPTDKSLRRGGRFSQAERNFGLSVLSLCGRLPDIDRAGECSPENNATFDKLMRDFAGQPIPFAMELFL